MSREQFTAESYREHLDEQGLDTSQIVDDKESAHAVALTANTYLNLAAQADRIWAQLDHGEEISPQDKQRLGKSVLKSTLNGPDASQSEIESLKKRLIREARANRIAAEFTISPKKPDGLIVEL